MTFKRNLLLTCISLAASGYAYSDEQKTTSSPSVDPSSKVDAAVDQPADDRTKVRITAHNMDAELTPDELELIKRKGDVLRKYLYQDQQLEELRDILKSDSRKEVYKKTVDEQYPLSPDEISRMRRLDTEVSKAKNAPLKNLQLDITSDELDVDVNKPITLRVARGYNATLVFFDQSGSPWPVEGDVIHDKNSFSSTVVSKTKHIVSFDIAEDFSESTAMITLEGHSVPIIVKLVGSDSVVDSRKTIRVLKYGPNAEIEPFVHNELENVSPDMLNILEGGNIPGDAKRYVLNGVSGDAYLYKGDLYVRTRAMLMSPPWKQSVVSNSGYRLYKMKPSSVLLFSNNGERQEATVESAFETKIKNKKTIFED
ncbi:DotH/IcmK family type IV secretion protein [Pseudomonas syringae pv. actinidiae]|nr:DotH/IcmK family type IV secretion protein [Pseudomonas syringae pv. actinidiae]